MLNTDAHNPQVKKKMTKQEWLRNNRGINKGKDLPDDFLIDVYMRITCDEIKMNEDPTSFANAVKKGWLQLKTAFYLKRFWFILADTSLYSFKKIGDTAPMQVIPLTDVIIIKDDKKKLVIHIKSTTNNTIMYSFLVPTERECDSWYVLLNKAAKAPFELPKRGLMNTMLTNSSTSKITVTNSK